MLKQKKIAIFILAFLMGLSSCSTMDSIYQGAVKLTDPDKLKIQGNVRWVNPQPKVEYNDDATVFLRIRNSSGTDFPVNDMIHKVRESLTNAGYQLTKKRNDAHFSLMLNIRAFGENAATKSISAGEAALAGAAIGDVLFNDDTGILATSAASAITASLFNRNKMIRVELVTDMVLGERIEGGVNTKRQSRTDDSSSSKTNRYATGSSNYGRSSGSSYSSQRVDTREDFLNHQNRLIAHAEKMQLSSEEAFKFLIDKMSIAIGGVLP